MNCRDRSAGRERAHRSSGPPACTTIQLTAGSARTVRKVGRHVQSRRTEFYASWGIRVTPTALALQPPRCPPFGHAVPSGSSVLGWRSFLVDNDLIQGDQVLAHGQITDGYLLALAVHHQGLLVTLDSRISTRMVRGGESLQVDSDVKLTGRRLLHSASFRRAATTAVPWLRPPCCDCRSPPT